MSKTAIGLFENPSIAKQVVSDLKAAGFPKRGIRILGEPRDLEVTGPTDTPRTDFEVALEREFRTFGASDRETNAYMRGVRRGGVLVFATGGGEEVDRAVDLMNGRGAMEAEEFAGREPASLGAGSGGAFPTDLGAPQTGRVRQPGGGAKLFVW